jgi:redox-sensitive bicupin YhaK (pirin superfamily)
MLLSWNSLETPLEGVTAAQLEAVFGEPEAITVEAGTAFTLPAEAPRTAFLVVSGALHGGGGELRLMPELAVPRREIAGLGRLILGEAVEHSFSAAETTVLVALDGLRLEAACTEGDAAAQAIFDAVVMLLSVDLRSSNEALQTLLQS